MSAPSCHASRLAEIVGRSLLAVLPRQTERSLLVGCSGGPDSTALLMALCSLRVELGLHLHAIYIDHGLRTESRAEGDKVRALAERLSVPAQVVRIELQPGAGLQERARAARYRALLDAALREGAVAVAVGHTASDQAETLLMRLLGGAGPKGLAGMAPSRPLTRESDRPLLVRPLLDASREDVLSALAESGVDFIRDPTNEDLGYLRSRVRHEVLPLMRRERPDLDRHLARLCAALRADAEHLQAEARGIVDRLRALEPQPPSGTVLRVADLTGCPEALFPRVLFCCAGQVLARRHVLAVRELCRSGAGSRSLDLPAGLRVERRYDRLHFMPDGAAEERRPTEHALVHGPGRYRLGEAEVELSVRALGEVGAASPSRAVFLLSALRFPLVLRHPRPGDRMRPRGMTGHRKVSDVLIDAKVPRALRPRVVLLCDGDEVLWTAGIRAAERGDPRRADAGAEVLLAALRGSS